MVNYTKYPSIVNMDSRSGPRKSNNKNPDNFQLTEEERKVLRECRMNSFMRGIPAGLLAALLTRFAIRTGTGNFPHLASWSRFYYAASFTGGLLFGVASYRKTCLEKIMKLENSVLADQVREYFRRAGIEYTGPQPHKQDSGFDDSPVSGYDYSTTSDSTPTSESIPSRSNDKENNSVGSNNWQNIKPEAEEPRSSNFEELRKQNRQKWHQDQYTVRHNKQMDLSTKDKRLETKQDEESSHHEASSHDKQTQGSTGVVRKNKYGDPIE